MTKSWTGSAVSEAALLLVLTIIGGAQAAEPQCTFPNEIIDMRQNWLSNRIFKSFDDIVDHCCYAWNTLIDQPWKIMPRCAPVRLRSRA